MATPLEWRDKPIIYRQRLHKEPPYSITTWEGLDMLMKGVRASNLMHISDLGIVEWRPDIALHHDIQGIPEANYSSPVGVLKMMFDYVNTKTQGSTFAIEKYNGQLEDVGLHRFAHDTDGAILAYRGNISPENVIPTLRDLDPEVHNLVVAKLRGKNSLALLGSITPHSAAGLRSNLIHEYKTVGDMDIFEGHQGIQALFTLMQMRYPDLTLNPIVATNLLSYMKEPNLQQEKYDVMFADVLGTYILDDKQLIEFHKNLICFLKPGGILVIRDIASKKIPDADKLISNGPPLDIDSFIQWLDSLELGKKISRKHVEAVLSNFWGQSGASRYGSLNTLYNQSFKEGQFADKISILTDINYAIQGTDKRYLKTVVVQKN